LPTFDFRATIDYKKEKLPDYRLSTFGQLFDFGDFGDFPDFPDFGDSPDFQKRTTFDFRATFQLLRLSTLRATFDFWRLSRSDPVGAWVAFAVDPVPRSCRAVRPGVVLC
jgi:hypothetical protein